MDFLMLSSHTTSSNSFNLSTLSVDVGMFSLHYLGWLELHILAVNRLYRDDCVVCIHIMNL